MEHLIENPLQQSALRRRTPEGTPQGTPQVLRSNQPVASEGVSVPMDMYTPPKPTWNDYTNYDRVGAAGNIAQFAFMGVVSLLPFWEAPLMLAIVVAAACWGSKFIHVLAKQSKMLDQSNNSSKKIVKGAKVLTLAINSKQFEEILSKYPRTDKDKIYDSLLSMVNSTLVLAIVEIMANWTAEVKCHMISEGSQRSLQGKLKEDPEKVYILLGLTIVSIFLFAANSYRNLSASQKHEKLKHIANIVSEEASEFEKYLFKRAKKNPAMSGNPIIPDYTNLDPKIELKRAECKQNAIKKISEFFDQVRGVNNPDSTYNVRPD